MRKKLHFTKTVCKEERLELHMDQPGEIGRIAPAGQMIVDSDEAAFVYLADENDEYVYLYIHETAWKELHQAQQEQKDVVAVGTDGEMILEGWQEELSDLVDNIEGNSNYGGELVEKVERVFLAEG